MKKFIGILLFLFLLSPLSATIYYVDKTTGDDGDSGLTEALAWETIAKVNGAAATLNPGDTILFKRGEEWREQLIVPETGTVGNIYTFGAYGSGAKPIIMESVAMNNVGNWTELIANRWLSDVTTPNGGDIGNLIMDGEASIGVKRPLTLGGELLTNPSFDANTDSWVAGSGCTLASVAGGQSNNCLEITKSNGGGEYARNPTATMVIGKTYEVSAYVKSGTSGNEAYALRFYHDGANVINLSGTSSGSWVRRYEKFTATTTAESLIYLVKNTTTAGTMLFDEASVKEITEPNAQGEFWFDPAINKIHLYSVGNPATVYNGDIECAKLLMNIIINAKDYITVENLDLRYGAYNAVQLGSGSDHIIVQHCDISYIGGGYFTGTTRSGNGINQWEAGDDIIARYNNISQVYDYAISTHGGGGPYNKTNQKFYYNVIRNCECAFEIMVYHADSDLDDIYFENNTCYDSGDVWSHNQRSGGQASIANHIDFIQSDSTTGGSVYIRNNIFKDSTEEAVSIGDWYPDIANLVLDYNCYYKAAGDMIYYQGDSYTMAQFAAYQAAKGKDASSIATDPLVIDEANEDFRLLMASPCINKGTDVGLTRDYRGRSIRHAPDIGAYEDPTNVLFMTRLFNYLKERK